MTAAADFIDAALQYESSWDRAEDDRERLGGGPGSALRFYGSSVGAVRSASLKFPGMPHDEILSLASELWSLAVYERRLAAVVLLQAHADLLIVTDLTRLEGFARSAGIDALVTPLAVDVVGPLIASLDGRDRARAEGVLARWAGEDPPLRHAARLALDESSRAT